MTPSYERFLTSIPKDVPDKAHPLVKSLFTRMRKQGICYIDMERRAGVSVGTLRKWRRGYHPRLPLIEACLEVVGRKVVDVGIGRKWDGRA